MRLKESARCVFGQKVNGFPNYNTLKMFSIRIIEFNKTMNNYTYSLTLCEYTRRKRYVQRWELFLFFSSGYIAFLFAATVVSAAAFQHKNLHADVGQSRFRFMVHRTRGNKQSVYPTPDVHRTGGLSRPSFLSLYPV